MSDFQAIGGVSATLQSLLEDRMELPAGYAQSEFRVTVGPPPSEEERRGRGRGSGDVKLRVNLYLYRVTENGFLKNQEIPGEGHPGAYGHPPLSLDLHYLLTAHGTSEDRGFLSEAPAQYLLGSAMRVLHDHPVITERMETSAGQPILHDSLRGEFEQVKLHLDPISLEDLSKVWTALTTPYHLSAAYKVSVVQIESRAPRTYPQLVGEPPPEGPRVYAVPFRSPQIRGIFVRRPSDEPDVERPFPYARVGDTLILKGHNFSGETTRVFLGSSEADIAQPRDSRIEVIVPDEAVLQPGAVSVKVVLDAMLGEPPRAHRGFQSNLAVFVLVPHISSLNLTTPTLKIVGTRLFHADLENTTLVGDIVIPSSGYTKATSTEIEFNLPASLESGEYPVRVRVNGAESIDAVTLVIP